MSVFDLFLIVVSLYFGGRLGWWFAEKQADAKRNTAVLDRRIDDESREIWARINQIENDVNEAKEKK
jgi:hypothetical protein